MRNEQASPRERDGRRRDREIALSVGSDPDVPSGRLAASIRDVQAPEAGVPNSKQPDRLDESEA
jgi:hypothetical protein